MVKIFTGSFQEEEQRHSDYDFCKAGRSPLQLFKFQD